MSLLKFFLMLLLVASIGALAVTIPNFYITSMNPEASSFDVVMAALTVLLDLAVMCFGINFLPKIK